MCPSKERIDGKSVIITGGNSGIGRETARQLGLRGKAAMTKKYGNLHVVITPHLNLRISKCFQKTETFNLRYYYPNTGIC